MAENTIARAYVQLVASADGISDSVKQAMGQAGSEGGKSFSAGFGNFMKGAGKVASAAVGAAAAGVTALTKEAVGAFADFEQLSGGVETLFGAGGDSIADYAASVGKSVQEAAAEYSYLMDAQNMVMKNAETAFKTSGLSQNDYMETVTGFSASLIASLEGDTVKAANVADMAIIDMSDNANKMGSSIESIQNAYSGFAKGNFTMLDNLKLGYGGTKSEMERLLQDATALSGVDYDIDSFADISEAIHVVQTNLGITGTTAKEASSTISGSIGQMQGAWTNLVAGLANPDADLGVLISDMVDSATTVIGNLTPAIRQALIGVSSLIQQMVPIVVELLPQIVSDVLPSLVSAVEDLISGASAALPSLVGLVASEIPGLFSTVLSALINCLPELVGVAVSAVVTLADGIGNALPELIPALVDVVATIVENLTSPESLTSIIGVALKLVLSLMDGVVRAVPRLLQAVPIIISNLVGAIVEMLPIIANAGVTLITAMVENYPQIVLEIVAIIPRLVTEIVKTFTGRQFIDSMKGAGVQLLNGLSNGLIEAGKNALEKAKQVANNVISTVKGVFGIHSPSRVFAEIGQFLDAGLANGIEQNLGVVDDAMGDMVDSVSFGTELNASYNSGLAPAAFNIVVNAAEGQNVEAIAEAVSRRIANEYNRERVVFA